MFKVQFHVHHTIFNSRMLRFSSQAKQSSHTAHTRPMSKKLILFYFRRPKLEDTHQATRRNKEKSDFVDVRKPECKPYLATKCVMRDPVYPHPLLRWRRASEARVETTSELERGIPA